MYATRQPIAPTIRSAIASRALRSRMLIAKRLLPRSRAGARTSEPSVAESRASSALIFYQGTCPAGRLGRYYSRGQKGPPPTFNPNMSQQRIRIALVALLVTSGPALAWSTPLSLAASQAQPKQAPLQVMEQANALASKPHSQA